MEEQNGISNLPRSSRTSYNNNRLHYNETRGNFFAGESQGGGRIFLGHSKIYTILQEGWYDADLDT